MLIRSPQKNVEMLPGVWAARRLKWVFTKGRIQKSGGYRIITTDKGYANLFPTKNAKPKRF